jgi:hypothetical protein
MIVLSSNVSFFNLTSAVVITIPGMVETPNLQFLKELEKLR